MRVLGARLTPRAHSRGGHAHLVTGDGLVFTAAVAEGFGAQAAATARAALQVVERGASERIESLLLRCHLALGATHGASMGIVQVHANGTAVFAAIGNVRIIGDAADPLLLYGKAGVVGLVMDDVRATSFALRPRARYAMLTSGLRSAADLDAVDADPAALIERYAAPDSGAAAVVFG